MAEGWARNMYGRAMTFASAGIEKHGMDPRAVKVMLEAGVDISHQHSKLIEELDDLAFDYVITLCDHAQESCPLFPGHALMIHQGFADPRGLAARIDDEDGKLDHYRTVRDGIRIFVQGLPQLLAEVRGA
jgi:arsenate reductase (thioredoxin)